MSITSAFVLYIVLWFLTFLVVIPFRLKTQGDVGKIVPGTMAGSPEVHHLKKKALLSTVLAALLWCIIAGIIYSGTITVRDMDWFDRMKPQAGAQG